MSCPRPDLLRVDEEAVALDPALVQSDSQPVLATRTAADSATLEAAVTLYRGPFMAGFDLPGAPEYEAWQAQTACQLEIHTLSLIERLVAHYTAAGDTPAVIRCAQRYLALDELAEAMHGRARSACTRPVGDRVAAERQYEQCALLLEQELGVSPLPETQAALRAGPIQRVRNPACGRNPRTRSRG